MKTIRLVIEFDGTDFVGWQLQGKGGSIQGEIEEALEKVLGEPVRIHSSGRTDAGVHARGMVAHFRTSRVLPMAAYREGVNQHLASSIAVKSASEAEDDFHARFSAKGKWYRYTLYQGAVRSPLCGRTSWHIRSPDLNLDAMRGAAEAFVGEHDFRAFRTSGCDAKTTRRQMYSVELTRQDSLVHIDVKGSGFLRHMVRLMVGTLVEIGLGKRPADDVAALLLAGDKARAGLTAPAQGLCLMEVWY